MILRVYAVHDGAIGAFLRPFLARSEGEAVRMWLAAVKEQPEFVSNIKDYSLFFLSEFNDVTGEYGVPAEERLSVPRVVMSGVEAMSLAAKHQVPPPFNRESVELSDEAQLSLGSGC